jgi:chromosome segregation ATPase
MSDKKVEDKHDREVRIMNAYPSYESLRDYCMSLEVNEEARTKSLPKSASGETMQQRRHRLMNAAPSYADLLGYCANIELALETLQEENRNKMEELRRSLNNKADLLQLSNSSLNQRLMNHWDAEKKALAQLGTMHIQLQLLENECEAIKKQRDDAEAFKASMKESYEHLENQYDVLKRQLDEVSDALAKAEDKVQVEHQKYLTSQDFLESSKAHVEDLLKEIAQRKQMMEDKLKEQEQEYRNNVVNLLAKNADLNEEARTFRHMYADQSVELAEVRGRLVDMQADYHEMRLRMWRQRMRPLAEMLTLTPENLKRPTTPDFEGIDECCKTVCPPSPKKPRIQPKVWVKETQDAEEEVEKLVLADTKPKLDLVVESDSSSSCSDGEESWSEDAIED